MKLSDLRQALKDAGIDPTSDQVKNLGFQEVYPGYFTVVDPELPKLCAEAGARYLYSTLDTPERIWQALTGGQKSSLTRFSEGMLVQGKSTASDFDTGGASSVFARLVTASAIDKGQKEKKSGQSHGNHKFQDWGGSRPFKLILNRRVLARTDWSRPITATSCAAPSTTATRPTMSCAFRWATTRATSTSSSVPTRRLVGDRCTNPRPAGSAEAPPRPSWARGDVQDAIGQSATDAHTRKPRPQPSGEGG